MVFAWCLVLDIMDDAWLMGLDVVDALQQVTRYLRRR